jgi:segregation and condensation protein B
MRTLVSRGLDEEAGQDPETTAVLYRTTGYFLERIGITSLDQLPELAPFVPDMDDADLEEALAGMASPEHVDLPVDRGPVDASVEDDGDR